MLPARKTSLVINKTDEIFDEPKNDKLNKPVKDMSSDDIKQFSKEMRKLSVSSHTKVVLNDLEQDRKKHKFIERIEKVLCKLENITIDDDEKLQKLFFFVMQSCNDLYADIHTEQAQKLCLQLLKRFFKDDEVLTKQVMTIVKPSIKKLTTYRKYKHNILHLFFLCFAIAFTRM